MGDFGGVIELRVRKWGISGLEIAAEMVVDQELAILTPCSSHRAIHHPALFLSCGFRSKVNCHRA